MATDVLTYAYAADITKSERDENGDLLVYGKATGSDIDLDGQRCDPDWLKKAMPAWFEWANVREMHQPIAAGVGIELTNEGDDWYVKSKVIDAGTARKIEAGALKGYSIGVKGPIIHKRNGQEWLAGGELCEISYVDRPCLPTAKMMICKMAGASAMEPVEAADAEARMIPTPKDLAERLSKAASSISSAQDLAARLGKAADTATSDEDSPEPAADPPVDVVEKQIRSGRLTVNESREELGVSPGPDVSPSVTIGTGREYAGDEPRQTKTIEVTVQGPSETRDAITKALIDELRVRSAEEVRRHSNKGAMPPLEEGGQPRYPINSVADLKDAIQAFGRAKDSDKAKVKAHIKSEAKRLGESALIPDNWKVLLVKDAAALDDIDDSTEWRHNPAQLRQVLSGLADCMKAELDELVAGDNELWDLTQLLSSISGFCSWWSSEAAGGETESPYTEGGSMAELAATPDATKAAEPVEPTTEEKVAEKAAAPETADDAPKTAEPSSEDLAELVKSAVAEATKGLTTAAEEREAALATELNKVKADLAKVLALPEPGGPVITRTAAQAAVARDKDNSLLQAEVDDLLRKASQASDRSLRVGWEQRAEEIKRKIA